MTYEYHLPLTCTDPASCSDAILSKLGHGPGFKLRADSPNDIIHGSVSILHAPDNHVVIVELYEQDEAPNEKRQSRLQALPNRPLKSDLFDRLVDKGQGAGLLARTWSRMASLFS